MSNFVLRLFVKILFLILVLKLSLVEYLILFYIDIG